MEVKVPRPRGRPRKRKRPEDEEKGNTRGKRADLGTVSAQPIVLMGRYVLKKFKGRVFLGKVVYYSTGLYRVEYEDGDCEDLESGEIRELVRDESCYEKDLSARKKKLEARLAKKSAKEKKEAQVDPKVAANGVETSTNVGLTYKDDRVQDEDDADSLSDSSEHSHGGIHEAGVPPIPPPQLPPSSGTIGVPEESVSHLLSIYAFLRSFSIQLFLSPFGLDDFVGAVNCMVPNSLLDAIHVALMCVLKRHLEMCSSDGSERASKCLRYIDWSLLDTLTWPVYLVQYVTAMGYVTSSEWKGLYQQTVEKEYYSLSVPLKLMILQILCDDVLDSVALRSEIDIRQVSELGIDPDGAASNASEMGPKRVHPRYSKTSACKDREAMNVVSGSHDMKPSIKPKAPVLTSTEVDADVDEDLDSNSDECLLCGMDGTLLCCDGCPSAYHSRCIGVAKMHIPDGLWYCPECTINKMEPANTLGTLLKGAHVFGVDLYGRAFLATCDHLLVVKASDNAGAESRYYNLNDIPKVVQVLLSLAEHASLYSDMCKAILQYWDIPQDVISTQKTIEFGAEVADPEINAVHSPLSLSIYKEKGQVALKAENGCTWSGSHVNNMYIPCPNTSTDIKGHISLSGGTNELQDHPPVDMKVDEQIIPESSISTGLEDCHQSSVGRSGTVNLTTSMSGRNSCSFGRDSGGGVCLPAAISGKAGAHGASQSDCRRLANSFSYMGAGFKSQMYVNHYMNGEFAAFAAACLAALSSEESHLSDPNKYSNSKKAASSSILLQQKAFASAASRFFWPSVEKKETTRERCGWCHSCKLSGTSKRGCMLNAALSSANRSATKSLNGLLPFKNSQGNLSSISAYILYLEESLRGLIVGPFISGSHREQWCKQVEKVSTCRAIKVLLLELGKNICTLALSADWFKLVGDCFAESSVIGSASSTTGTAQKRGPGGKRLKKQIDLAQNNSSDDRFSWWRGGKFSKHILQKAVLPCMIVRKAARQGGCRKISVLNYIDGSEVPRCTRQLVWRAGVESSRNMSQLALQVRYLDIHVRWNDLVRPEQILHEGKGPETEASTFRNAKICDKKVVDNKVRYGIAFGSQKHLPSRVMKNAIEVEQTQDGKEKYWFLEKRIPLYLIKEYEEHSHKGLPSARVNKPSNKLSNLQRKQLKVSRRDLYSYLACKRDNLEKCSCASCHMDVLLRNAVTCNTCQGYCHKDCTSSAMCTNGKVEFSVACKRCYSAKAHSQRLINYKSPNSVTPLPLSGREHHNCRTAIKSTPLKVCDQPLAPARIKDSSFRKNQTTSDSSLEPKSKKKPSESSLMARIQNNLSESSLGPKSRKKICSWGVIWRKKNCEDTGVSFRQENILQKGTVDRYLRQPVCDLCQQLYRSDMTYIHCIYCKKWYHAEAVELDDLKIPDVVSFKCCKCRRIRSPDCPYMGTELRMQKLRKQGPRKTNKFGHGNTGTDSDSGTVSEPKDSVPTTPFSPEDDPSFFSLSQIEQITENNSSGLQWDSVSAPVLKKLPVRRQVKPENDMDGNSSFREEISIPLETTPLVKPEEGSLPVAEWNASANGIEDLMIDYESCNYEDMQFEPQTYFSLKELLDDEGGDQSEGFNSRVNIENQSNNFSRDVVSIDNPELMAQANTLPCRICLHLEPYPDLSCQVCGFLIHTYCSPWEESSSCPKDNWRCGRCRDWC